MNKISLQKVHSSGPGSAHVKLLINDKDVGILYLKEEELDVLLKCLKNGVYHNDTNLETDIFDDENDIDEDSLD
jgi:hypothetical protein